jgi:hypothetical protein
MSSSLEREKRFIGGNQLVSITMPHPSGDGDDQMQIKTRTKGGAYHTLFIDMDDVDYAPPDRDSSAQSRESTPEYVKNPVTGFFVKVEGFFQGDARDEIKYVVI